MTSLSAQGGMEAPTRLCPQLVQRGEWWQRASACLVAGQEGLIRLANIAFKSPIFKEIQYLLHQLFIHACEVHEASKTEIFISIN